MELILNGKVVRLLRTSREIPVEELSKKSGVSPTMLYKIEQGARGITKKNQQNIREAFLEFGVTEEEFETIQKLLTFKIKVGENVGE